MNGIDALKSGLIVALITLAIPFQAQAQNIGSSGYKTPVYTTGVEAYRRGDYQSAMKAFKQVLQRDESNANAHYYLGLALDNLGMSTEAASQYQWVVRQSHQARITDFALARLTAMGVTASESLAPETNLASIGLNAASQAAVEMGMLPTVYHGSTSQVAVPLKNSRNALMVDAVLSQHSRQADGSFIIDTGATYTSISGQMADALGLDLENCEKVAITTANGRIEVPKVIIETLSVNGLEARNVEATVIPVRQGSSFSGLLGLSFIRQFVLTIDPQAGHLIFRKN